jgi:hypothetical protein
MTQPRFHFPDEINGAYSAIMNWLRSQPDMDRFERRMPDLNGITLPDIGGQVSRYLPSHVMKVYRSLLRLQEDRYRNDDPGLLGQPNITVIDNGCGAGTASVALISMMVNYQHHRMDSGLPIYPIRIQCFGIDPNEYALTVYPRFVRECASRVARLLVDVEVKQMYLGTLVTALAELRQMLDEQQRSHCVVLALANIIRPLTTIHEERSKKIQVIEALGFDWLLPQRGQEHVGRPEAAVIDTILASRLVDKLAVVLVGALSTRDGQTNQSWLPEMREFQREIASQLSQQHDISIQSVEHYVHFIANPPESFHRKHRGYVDSDEREYDAGHIWITNANYMADTAWQQVLDFDNLMLAWARVRNSLAYDALEDTLEIRLFEVDVEERIRRLRAEVLSYNWEALRVAEMLNFQVPKGIDRLPRPMSLCRLEDQILATAVLQVKSREYRQDHNSRSYAYGLADGNREQLYRGWYQQYRRFLSDARSKASESGMETVVQTDLTSFYTTIVQDTLWKGLSRDVNLIRSRTSTLARNLIYRDCGLGESGMGIPQGHIISGALANIYLSPVDDLFDPGNDWGVEYYRYVDDMIMVLPTGVDETEILAALDRQLDLLDLTRSERKTKVMTTKTFLAITEQDDVLEELGQRHNYLLADLYRIPPRYAHLASSDWWAFVRRYQRLIGSIGVFLSLSRLSRKVYRNLKWWRRLINLWNQVRFPSVDSLAELEDVDCWREEFRCMNSTQRRNWVGRRSHLVHDLSELMQNSLDGIEVEDDVDRNRAQQRLRFAVNRLGQLGFGDLVDEVIHILVETPWLIRPRQVCRDLVLQGHERLLLEAFGVLTERDEAEWSYVRAAILKAFSHSRTLDEESIDVLQNIAAEGATVAERTMATEVLILKENTDHLDDVVLHDLIEVAEPYLAKNYAILYSSIDDEVDTVRAELDRPDILNEALEYVRVQPDLTSLRRIEPELLRDEYYERQYPDGPEEFEDFIS